MAESANFIQTPNNVSIRIDSGDSLETLDWQAGANGGRLRQIYVRVEADQDVVVAVAIKIGNLIWPFLRTIPASIPTTSVATDTSPPTALLHVGSLPHLSEENDNRGLNFAEGDGVRMHILTELDAGEYVYFFAFGDDY